MDGKKKRVAIISVSTILLVAMVVAVTVGVTRSTQSSPTMAAASTDNLNPSIKAIKTICQPVDYKDACVDSLSAVASGNTTDPKDLIKLAFKVAVDKIKEAFGKSTVIKQAQSDPRTKEALDNCAELMSYAIDELQNSITHVGNIDFTDMGDLIDNLKTWLSAAVTYQDTCIDGFENTTGNAADKMKEALKSSTELTSNTLAIVNEIESLFSQFKLPFLSRRLLTVPEKEGFPRWLQAGNKRLLQASPAEIKPDLVVAKDGSGKYKTINDALNDVPLNRNTTFVIYIKEGVYQEMVQINRSMTNIMFMGDGPTKTKITGNVNFIDGTPTFKTATVAIVGDGFIARDIGFENSAGPEKHQAVALRVMSDRSIFYNCQMDGYQDTLYAHTKRQFYRDCSISGTIDFIFGDSAVVFQNCLIVVRKPLDNQQNTVTAQGRKDRHESTALILHNCTIIADPLYYPVRNKLPTYLGRPWKEYSRAFIMQSYLDDLVQPAGWMPWAGDFALNTLFYSEFDNRGPGANLTGRVHWKGLKPMTPDYAKVYTVSNFIQGDQWIKASGVPYTPSLLSLNMTDVPYAIVQAQKTRHEV